MRDVQITREPVELYKILKFEGLAENGGAAKAVIEQGLVTVNGEVETRKRKQIVVGDVIGYEEHELRIVRGESEVAVKVKPPKPAAGKPARRKPAQGRPARGKSASGKAAPAKRPVHLKARPAAKK